MLRLPPLLLAAPALAAEAITGHATVIDGDTIEVQGRRVDLHGIDAPEAAQTCETAAGRLSRCGQVAAAALRQQIGGAAITCEPQGTATKERPTALCRVGGVDLSAWMVGHGHALALRQVAQGCTHQERRAWATRSGVAGTGARALAWPSIRQAEGRGCGAGSVRSGGGPVCFSPWRALPGRTTAPPRSMPAASC